MLAVLVIALGIRDRVAVDALGRVASKGLADPTRDVMSAAAAAAGIESNVPEVVRKFDAVSASLDGLKAKLAHNLEEFDDVAKAEEAKEEADPSSLLERHPSIDEQFADLRARIKEQMKTFKDKVDKEIDAKMPSSLIESDPQIKVEAKLQALESKLRTQITEWQKWQEESAPPAKSALLQVGPEDEPEEIRDEGPSTADNTDDAENEREAAEDKKDEENADALANEAGPETAAEKAETKAEEKTAEEEEQQWSDELEKDKVQQQAMLDKIKKIGKVDKPKEMSRGETEHLGDSLAGIKKPGHPSSFVETEKHMRSAHQFQAFTWSALPHTYHTFAQMLSTVDDLKGPCAAAGFTLERTTVQGRAGPALPDEPVVLETVTLTPKAPQRRAAAVFGEHPRELISPETGLTMLQALCGQAPACDGCSRPQENLADVQKAAKTSAHTQWLIVLNSNPLTRKKIEETNDFCLRLDPEGVDTNRNYDDHFYDTTGVDAQTHGSEPFSAPEVDALQRVLADFRPTTFFSIHSGEQGLYTPHAWSTEYDSHIPEAVALSKVPGGLIPEDYEIGSAGELQGRPITGSSFDYVKDKLGAKYSYAFELYKNASRQPYSAETCFAYFNPTSVQKYTEVTRRMAAVILETAANSQ